MPQAVGNGELLTAQLQNMQVQHQLQLLNQQLFYQAQLQQVQQQMEMQQAAINKQTKMLEKMSINATHK